MRRIAYTRADGGLSIVTPAISHDDPVEFTEQDALDRALAKDVPPDAQGAIVIEASEIPQDRTYRNAWANRDGKIEPDMAKAKEVHRDILRRERVPLLAALDIEFMRAVEAGDQSAIAGIAKRKQALRDAPADPQIDAAETVDTLKAIGLPAIESSRTQGQARG